jgi:uncharacterized phiE125 gp8 family phage protein
MSNYPYWRGSLANSYRACLLPWQQDMRNRAFLRIITPPSSEPISLDEAAQHLRIDAYGSPASYLDQELIEALIPASREYVEFISGLALAPQVVELSGRGFTGMSRWIPDFGISLMTAPVRGILSVTYKDGDGIDQVMAEDAFILDNAAEVPVLYPAYGANDWPSCRDQPGSIRIRMSVGYDVAGGSPADNIIPYSLIAAMKLVLGALYENREEINVGNLVSKIPLGVQALVERYRIRMPIA